MSIVDRVRVFSDTVGPSRTKQSEAMSSDINQIVNRHIVHRIPIFADVRARYGDFSNIGDYHSSLERVRSSNEEFMKLPSAVRDACNNDVGVLLDKLSRVESREDLVKLGLVDAAIPAALPAPVPAEPVP